MARTKLQPHVTTKDHLWKCPWCGIPFKGRKSEFEHHATHFHYSQFYIEYLSHKGIAHRRNP